jgi:hypothetical protein
MTFVQRLLDILSTLDQTFHSNELAYLAVTSKVEGPIRDRIAYRLHMELEPDLLIHREWRDKNNRWIDIAVTDDQNRPRQLLELKAHSAPTFQPGYSDMIRQDCQKLHAAGGVDTELYILLLFNHLYHPAIVDRKFERSVKYYQLQNFASRQNAHARDVSEQTRLHWEKHLQNIGAPATDNHPGIRMNAGEYHGMPMAVHAHILGPLSPQQLKEFLR